MPDQETRATEKLINVLVDRVARLNIEAAQWQVRAELAEEALSKINEAEALDLEA